MTNSSPEEGIEAIYRTYVDTFNRQDAEGVSKLLSYPAMMGGTGHPPQSMPDAASFQSMIEGTFEHFRSKGWVRSQVDHVDAVAMAGNTGVLRAEFSRYREDGSLIERGAGHYVTLFREGRWTIIAAIVE